MKPLFRVGVKLLAVRYVAVDKPIEALPGQPVSLAPPKQGVPPGAANLTAEALQPSEIAWHRMVVEITPHHAVQPLADLRDGFVPSPLSVPVKKNISSAGWVSSSPVGEDAVKNSIVVSKFSAILAFYFRVSANRCSVRVPGGNCLRLWPCELRLA
jgi:hypothetical protein